MNKVFLGGTCNESNWRNELIPLLKIEYFNPVLKDWTEDCQKEEERQKKICNYQLYVITPRMSGVFSIAEVVDSSNKNPQGTIFCVLDEDRGYLPCTIMIFDYRQIKSLKAVKNLVKNNGAKVCNSLAEVAEFLNTAGTAGIKACGDMSKDTCAAHEAHESLAHG